jgi:hypothetical protein
MPALDARTTTATTAEREPTTPTTTAAPPERLTLQGKCQSQNRKV